MADPTDLAAVQEVEFSTGCAVQAVVVTESEIRDIFARHFSPDDWVGDFLFRGRYSVVDGKCYWNKHYIGKHDVYYDGYNEGKGIWGRWEISSKYTYGAPLHGGFHIWPEGMDDPTQQHLAEAADLPAPVEDEAITVGIPR